MPWDLGDTVRLEATATDAAGTAVNATTATLTITLPDGVTTVTPAITNPPATAGAYVFDYVPAVAGRHQVRWTFAGPASATTDLIDVRPADPELIVSLADAKSHLNITSTRYDDELRAHVEATTAVVERHVGAVVRRTYIERHAGGKLIVIDNPPVLAVSSVTAVLDGAADEDVAELTYTPTTGVIQRNDAAEIVGPVDVTYIAGRSIIPANHRQAALIIIQHLWETQRGSVGGPRVAGAEPFQPGGMSTFTIPRRALELLGEPLPGIA